MQQQGQEDQDGQDGQDDNCADDNCDRDACQSVPHRGCLHVPILVGGRFWRDARQDSCSDGKMVMVEAGDGKMVMVEAGDGKMVMVEAEG